MYTDVTLVALKNGGCMQPDWWKYIVDVAQILSAIGTCGAVVVALWVAMRPPILHIDGNAGMRIVVGRGVVGKPEYVHITVVNNGEREFIVTGLAWVPLPKSKLHALQIGGVSDQNVTSDSFPKKLMFGETASFFMRADGPGNWFDLVRKRSEVWTNAYSRKESLQKLRLHVSTSVGRSHEIKPEQGFIDHLWPYVELAIKDRAAKVEEGGGNASQVIEIERDT